MRLQSFVEGVIVRGSHGAWAFPNEVRKLFRLLDLQLLSRDTAFPRDLKIPIRILIRNVISPKLSHKPGATRLLPPCFGSSAGE